MKLGFIGFGEVGFEISMGLKQEGVSGIIAYDVMHDHPSYSALLKERADKAAVSLQNSAKQVIDQSDVIIVAVPGAKALETAIGIKEFLNDQKLYVDVSASAPSVKKELWANIEGSGALFVDGAMLGSLPVYKHKVPTLISGSGAAKFYEMFKPLGMDLEQVSAVPGDATGIKFVRSIFMKGLPALLVEVIEAADTMKVDHLVLPSIYKTMAACSFEDTVNRLVTGSSVHAERRAHEMKDVISMLESIGVEPTMSKASYERLSWLASKNLKEKFAGRTPKQWKEVVEAWK